MGNITNYLPVGLHETYLQDKKRKGLVRKLLAKHYAPKVTVK